MARITVSAEKTSMKALRAMGDPKSLGNRHYPMRHDVLLDIVDETLKQQKHHVSKKEHFISHGGIRMYTSYILGEAKGKDDFSMAMAVTGAQDRTSSAKIMFGTNIFICANGCYSGEVVLRRKNTMNALDELPEIVDKGVHMAGISYKRDSAFLEGWKRTEITSEQQKSFLFDVMMSGLLPRSHVLDKVFPLLETPTYEEHRKDTVYAMHNSFTEAHKTRVRNNPTPASEELIRLDQMFKECFPVEKADGIVIPDEFLHVS